ncbi:hypothetical protein [Yinghuangia soli]|uniref:Uncharacterized protein n=1 Tax=Yinghuangia soli TaxID=2908204 RepID=A0AA41Q8E9_9ACTN|nr:hypothetical protein [Yinghuangia soli]MCF2533126.1 hypothetical protein [Yinghuangia soli]
MDDQHDEHAERAEHAEHNERDEPAEHTERDNSAQAPGTAPDGPTGKASQGRSDPASAPGPAPERPVSPAVAPDSEPKSGPESGPESGPAPGQTSRPALEPASAHAAHREAEERTADRHGGPGHYVLLVLLIALPMVKLAWTVGGGTETRDVITAMGPANWPDVLVGMVLGDALLAALVAVVGSRVSFAYFAARGAVPHGDDRVALARLLGLACAVPISLAVLMAVFFGPWWALATGVTACALRVGVIAEYRTGRRGRDKRGRAVRHQQTSSGRRRITAVGQWSALVLTVVALPVAALANAFDGRSWASVVVCNVEAGDTTEQARMIEIDRRGDGVVGWDLDADEIANGTACVADSSDVIRGPAWRS